MTDFEKRIFEKLKIEYGWSVIGIEKDIVKALLKDVVSATISTLNEPSPSKKDSQTPS